MEQVGEDNKYQKLCETILEVAEKRFETKRNDKLQCKWSDTTSNLLAQRAQARGEGYWDEAQRIDKLFRKSLKAAKCLRKALTSEVNGWVCEC